MKMLERFMKTFQVMTNCILTTVALTLAVPAFAAVSEEAHSRTELNLPPAVADAQSIGTRASVNVEGEWQVATIVSSSAGRRRVQLCNGRRVSVRPNQIRFSYPLFRKEPKNWNQLFPFDFSP